MNNAKEKQLKRERRRGKIRAKISGTADCLRLSVFRSNKGMFLQLINDVDGKTLVSASSQEIKTKAAKVDVSFELGKLLAEKALAKGVKRVVFDRGGFQFHGRVKAVADGAREGGLDF